MTDATRSLSSFRRSRFRDALAADAVIAYPTEGVYGLGCLADSYDALLRIVALKGRSAGKGLILLVADEAQLDGWVDDDLRLPDRGSAKTPLTWIVPAGPRCDTLVTGGRRTVAVRVTHHPIARALCALNPEPLVSTSANISGLPAITSPYVLRRTFRRKVDGFVPGPLGGAAGPSEIRELATGRVLRAALRK
ncbi:MAG: L-threonylcarbamoyladenylate synthase [Pseudomonadota bacterium]